jgi:hypothetical protein
MAFSSEQVFHNCDGYPEIGESEQVAKFWYFLQTMIPYIVQCSTGCYSSVTPRTSCCYMWVKGVQPGIIVRYMEYMFYVMQTYFRYDAPARLHHSAILRKSRT